MLTGVPFLGRWYVQQSTGARIFRGVSQVPAAPVAIVLGAAVYADGTPSAVLRDRLQAALDLYRAGKVKRLLLSGDHGTRGYDEVHAMRGWLMERGVPSARLFMDHAGLRTLDSMQRAVRVFEVERAVVCTQAFHLPRALYLAQQAGMDAVGLVADRRTYATAAHNDRRELLAVTRALLDVHVLGTQPRHLGGRISIRGDARSTHDQHTR